MKTPWQEKDKIHLQIFIISYSFYSQEREYSIYWENRVSLDSAQTNYMTLIIFQLS